MICQGPGTRGSPMDPARSRERVDLDGDGEGDGGKHRQQQTTETMHEVGGGHETERRVESEKHAKDSSSRTQETARLLYFHT